MADAPSTPEPGYCPWCGDPLPPPKPTGRPRQTCGKSNCRRRNGAANAVRQAHAEQIETLRAELDETRSRLQRAEWARELDARVIASDTRELLDAIDAAFDQAQKRSSEGGLAIAQVFVDALRKTVVPKAREIASRARRVTEEG